MDRLPPLGEDEWTEKARQAISPTIRSVATMMGDEEISRPEHKKPLNILLTLAHNDHLIGPFLQWAAALAVQGALERRDAELLALRAAWNCRSDFEWGHHVDYAEHFGLDRAEIDRVPAGPDASGWMPHQGALLRAADELHSTAVISDATYRALTAAFNPAQLIEIVMTVGQYTMLSFVANTFEVEIEPGLEPLPARS